MNTAAPMRRAYTAEATWPTSPVGRAYQTLPTAAPTVTGAFADAALALARAPERIAPGARYVRLRRVRYHKGHASARVDFALPSGEHVDVELTVDPVPTQGEQRAEAERERAEARAIYAAGGDTRYMAWDDLAAFAADPEIVAARAAALDAEHGPVVPATCARCGADTEAREDETRLHVPTGRRETLCDGCYDYADGVAAAAGTL